MCPFQRKTRIAIAVTLLAATMAFPAFAAYDLTSEPLDEIVPSPDEKIWLSDSIVVEDETCLKPLFLSGMQSGLASSFFQTQEDVSRADVTVIVDGRDSDPDQLSFVMNGVTYSPLRDVCEALGAETSFDPESKTAYANAEGVELTIPLNEPYLVANGRYLYIENGFVLKNGCTMVPLRTICDVFGAQLLWDENEAAAYITSGGEPIESGDTFYDEKDLYWMIHIINAEAGNEPFIGKIAVGNVIMNRVKSSSYPNTVYDVIFDNANGVQFTPTVNGSIYSTPNYGCDIAAKLALEGANVIGDAMYFSSAYLSCWASRNRPFLTQIGSHAFYA